MTKKKPMVGQRVRTIRETSGLQMKQFSRLFAGDRAAYFTYNLEYGYSAKNETIDEISKVFKVSRDWILGEDVPMASPQPSPEKVKVLKEALKGVGVKPGDLTVGGDEVAAGLAILRLRSVL